MKARALGDYMLQLLQFLREQKALGKQIYLGFVALNNTPLLMHPNFLDYRLILLR
jgi:hypothetical protein